MGSYHIIHQLHINASLDQVFDRISTTKGLDQWWSLESRGRREAGSIYELGFGSVDWQAQITHMVPPQEFELTMTRAEPDWINTIIRFELTTAAEGVDLKFSHLGWPRANDHYYISNHCWGLYLRILRRHLEHDESVPYHDRLKA